MHNLEKLLEKLACPVCRAKVQPSDGGLVCKDCYQKFQIVNGVPVMLDESDFYHVEITRYQVPTENGLRARLKRSRFFHLLKCFYHAYLSFMKLLTPTDSLN